MTNDTRAAFEAWEKSRGGNLTRHDSGLYANSAMQGRWTVWQASRRAALEEAAQVCGMESVTMATRDQSRGALHCAAAIRALADEGVA